MSVLKKSRVLCVLSLLVVAGGALAAGFSPASARVPAAADLRCEPRGCVNKRDLAADSVTRGKIAPGAVTGAKIADGSVGERELAFDPLSPSDLDGYATRDQLDGLATSGDLDAMASGLATGDGSGPNVGSNRVHWENIVGMPAGFADGTDDLGGGGSPAPVGPASDVVCTGCVGGTDLATDAVTSDKIDDGSVTPDDLSFDPGTATDLNCTGCIGSTDIENGTIATGDLAFDPYSDVSCTGCVEASDLDAGSVESAEILNGTIAAADLAGSYDAGVETVVGAVTGEKIADGTIEDRDISNGAISTTAVENGAITTQKMTANAQMASNLLPVAGDTEQVEVVLSLPAGADHLVQLNGQVQATCSCTTGEFAEVSWYLTGQIGAGTPTVISPVYRDKMYTNDQEVVATISMLDVASAGQEVTYRLVADVGITPSSGTSVITFSNALLTAVDLGQR